MAMPLHAQQGAGGGAGAASAAVPVQGPAVAVEVQTVTGKVSSIDREQRRVAVSGDDGRVATLVVGPGVRNFENLKVGDRVTMRYTEAVSLAIAKGTGDASKIGELRTKVEAEAARQAPPGGKPGVSATERATLVANVFKIDRERGILTVRGTDGVPVDIRVPDRRTLEQIKLDDQLIIGYRQAAAVAVEPAGTS